MYSPRVFFVVGADGAAWSAAEAFARAWAPHVTFHALTGPPDVFGLPPKSPYSVRAGLAEEAFVDDLEAGAYPELYDPTEANKQ